MTPQRRLRDRWKGERQSAHVEDRRGEQMPAGTSPSDSAGMMRGSPDIQQAVNSGWENDVAGLPVEKARHDRDRSDWSTIPAIPAGTVPQQYLRRKRKVRY